MIPKIKQILPEWVFVHLPQVIIVTIGIITASIVLTSQFIRQAENQLFSLIESAYQEPYALRVPASQ